MTGTEPGERGWTVACQRHRTCLTRILDEGPRLKAITAGVTRHGEYVGRWPATPWRDGAG
ncbi:hypothetical protein AB0469_14415 [Streptomyces sp. NPDC093801]|uniref:hypothetical protein n=1 Tax=Streptomyces sp. NPDC093801 TaxID=3155203 RepID=UPI00344DB9F1